ncbi:peptidase domain-containing ABC transporter [Dysgonomonas sp. 25]|uniref:peptidase domain-containing ABC transporter n=1 Tax=Dysgonomonas sp. 25 TaxID=2302933 RepID=UPI0013D0B7E6|nr:peptidase domain-containing ABC transporter [Dysgonomonas sp. 25]NDV68589.1 peptidase domain-containing ABC transporter [Dysgonomonas sp. 25]
MIGKVKKSLFFQHDKADCGIACLMMVLKYYNRSKSIEELRYLSGTTKEGTTLAGLYQCANKVGFKSEGCIGDTEELEKSVYPIILRVSIDGFLHYVVFFYYDKKSEKYIIGDPARGIQKLNKTELETIWEGQYCLTVIPDEDYEHIYEIKNYKKDKRKFITNLITKDKKILFHGLFFSLIISILGLSLSVYSQQLVDNILPSQNSTKIIGSIIVLGILLITRTGLAYIKGTLFNYQSRQFNNRITNTFYENLLLLPKPFFNTRKVGDLVARINDTTKIQSVIQLFFSNYINDILTVIVAVILIFYYSVPVGIIALCFIPVLVCLIMIKSKNIVSRQREVQVYYALTEANYISTISGISDIKNMNREEYFAQHNGKLFEEYQAKRFSLASIYVSLNAIISIFSTVFLISIISLSIYYIGLGLLSIGDLIALLSISGLIISSTTNFSLLFIPFTEAKISFERMYNIMNIKKDEVDNTEEIAGVIETIKAENISFGYAGIAKSLYSKATLELKKGTITTLTGNCGVGKSTLLDILLGNYQVNEGHIFYNDLNLSDIDKKYIKDRIRVVPQNVHIFNGNILFNITMTKSLDVDRINSLIQELNLLTFFNDFPQNIYTEVGEEGISLSGGQKQIIGILRALYDNPQVLFLDEPTSSLDKDSAKIIYQLLAKIKPNLIILFISHDISIFDSIVDKTYRIENNRIIDLIQ